MMARRYTIGRLAQTAIILLLCCALTVPVASAQDGAIPLDSPPPELGDVIVEDALTGPGRANVVPCQTGKNPSQFGEDGLSLTLNGSCFPNANAGFQNVQFPGLNVPDGEIRFDLRVAAGYDRLFLSIITRNPAPAPGVTPATVRKPTVGLGTGIGRATITVAANTSAGRAGLKEAIPPDTWVTVAIRLQGPSVWLLIDDQPFLSFTDPAPDASSIGTGFSIGALKTGALDDGQDVSWMLRNLRVTALAGSEVGRIPNVGQPQNAPPAAAAGPAATLTRPATPTPMGEPWIGDIRFGYDSNGGDGVSDGGSLPIKENQSVLASFSWRNVAVGSTMSVESFMDDYPPRRADARVTQPRGQTRFAVLNLGSVSGGATWVSTGVTLAVYLNGNELARAHVTLK